MDKELVINGLKYKLVEEEPQPIYKFNDLMWSKTFSKMPWQEAIKFCEDLNYGGYSDWRLPTVEELITLIDYKKRIPACSKIDCESSGYWSATTNAYDSGYAWLVYFDNGSVLYGNKTNSYYVRAVRG